jgi:hypothetical protein
MPIPYRFIDFPPEMAQERVLGVTTSWAFASLQETVLRANEWIVTSGVNVVNIETVLLPAPFQKPEYNTGANGFHVADQMLVQVVRVWYHQPE